MEPTEVYAVVRADGDDGEWVDWNTASVLHDEAKAKFDAQRARCPHNTCNQSMPFRRVGRFQVVELP